MGVTSLRPEALLEGRRLHAELIVRCADEVSKTFAEARADLVDPVIVLIDPEDSLGRRVCEHLDLAHPVGFQVLAFECDEILTWLDSVTLAAHLTGTEGGAIKILVIALEGASVHRVPLGEAALRG